jgi:hypothetical protein
MVLSLSVEVHFFKFTFPIFLGQDHIRVAEPTQQEGREAIFRAALLKGLPYLPRVIITDKLKRYGAAKREILQGWEHRQHSRIESSSRELASAHKTAREEDEEIQISPHTPNAFFPRSVPSVGISSREDTICMYKNIVPLYRTDSSNETRVTGAKLVS